ncbi:hypothetical protein [Methylorubrum populi]|jgi:hypothetical protein|nr:hypothetical protein [Methylorubrum populi]
MDAAGTQQDGGRMDGIGSLATIMLSGVVAAVSTYALNSSKEHVFHRRTKAEELYKAFDGWQASLLD